MKKIEITKEELSNLYEKEEKTVREISRIFNCRTTKISNLIKEYGLKKPKKNKINISKEKLFELYINQNLSAIEIGEKIGCSNTTIKKRLKEYDIKKPMELTINKMKQTCLNKYGVENPSQSEKIKNKKKETCLKNHGVEHPSQSYKIKDKMKKTILKNYGVEHPMQSEEVKNKIKETCLKKYGVEHPLQSEEVKNKIKETCLNKYGVECSLQSDKIKDKIKETCLKKYRVENPMQSDIVKNKSKKTCLKKYGVENHNQKHIKNLKIWNDNKLFYNWVQNKSNELGRKVCSGDVAEFFNIDATGTAISKLHLLDNIKDSSRYYNINESYFESLIVDWLKINNINYERNDRTIIKPYELDFVLPNYNIAIEMNDTWSHNIQFKIEHHDYDYLDALYYHEKKLKLAKEKGYFLIHIYDKDLDNLDEIIKPLLKKKFDINNYEINSKVYWVKGKDWVYDDDVIDLSDEGYVMMVESNWYL